MEGRLIQGDLSAPVLHATTKPHRMKDHRLFFEKEKPAHYRHFKRCATPVIVTAAPEDYQQHAENGTIIQVADVHTAYWQFVTYYRGLFNIPVIGVTGTSGKTTTKEMIRHILSGQYSVCATDKSRYDISLCLDYLLRLDEQTGAAVFEMGVIWPDDLNVFIQHFRPTIRVLLNVGVHHLHGCRTPGNYLRAKAKMLDGLTPGDTVILNADDENIRKIDTRRIGRLLSFGLEQRADYRADGIGYTRYGMSFTLQHPGGSIAAFVPGFGKHNVYNALAAIAAATQAGMDTNTACARLATFQPLPKSLELKTGKGGCLIIDDTGNTSPPSVLAALEVLRDVAGSRRKVAFIGSIPLLGRGRYATEQYARVGERAAAAELDALVLVGDSARTIGERAIELGMKRDHVFFHPGQTTLCRLLSRHLHDESAILLKVTASQLNAPQLLAVKNIIEGDNGANTLS